MSNIQKKSQIIDPTAPAYLYKYQAINEQSIKNLDEQILWASKPNAFNDPFELKFSENGSNPHASEIDLFIRDSQDFNIICLTLDPVNILMWAHYANNHTGMCLGFLGNTYTIPVNYSNDFPQVDFTKNDQGQRELEIFRILVTKSNRWSYELERRMLFVPGTNPKVQYPGPLFMVAFGLNTPHEKILEIKSKINNPDVEYFQCVIKPNSYEFDLSKLTL